MKYFILSFSVFPLFLCAQAGKLEIPPATSFKVVFSQKEGSRVALKNRSNSNLKIEIQNRFNEAFVSGFGLSPFGKAEINIQSSEILSLENTDTKSAKVRVNRLGSPQLQQTNVSEQYISFSILNSSNQSIPLQIPGVMNPNLSPNSQSSVRLKVGQKVYYKKGIKRILIYTVDDTLEENTQLDVYKLLQSKDLLL